MVRLKQAHPHCGPRKFQALYQRQHGGEVPSESSFKRVLERAGLTVLRRVRRVRRVTETGRLGQGREGLRVEPLTVRDEHSRMLLEMQVLANSQTATVRACFERLFERYGMF
jgi:hypothetical protein